MTTSSVPLRISAAWIALTLVTVLAFDASSLPSWVLATTIGMVPPAVLLGLWSDGPPPAVAEVLHTTEVTR